MNDLISRQAAIDAINKAFERVFAWDGTSPLGDKVLENVPSAQPKQKTGHWQIYIISMLDEKGCKCSRCGHEGVLYWNFCPNCGADMRGEK